MYFFREDFRRVYLDDIGSIDYAPRVKESYIEDFLNHLNSKAIQEAAFNLVVDFADAPVANVLPLILDELNCNVVALNANASRARGSISEEEFKAALKQMRIITTALGMQLGIYVDPGGEKIFLVDDQGHLLPGITAYAAMVEMALRDAPGSTIVIPLNLPNLFEKIATRYDGHIIYTEVDLNTLIKTACSENVIIAGDGKGSFIFPDFQCAVDGLMALAKMLEFLATQKVSLSEVVANLPPYHLAQRKVPCEWDARARVMRLIGEKFESHKNQTTHGLKMALGPNEWVLVVPDPEQPCFRVTAEAGSLDEAEAIAEEHAQIVSAISLQP